MITEFAPAKINLFLDVLRKREDGYHDLGTFFQTVYAGDELQAEPDLSGEITLVYSVPQEYPVESDLVYRAAQLLKNTYKVNAGARLRLVKNLPLGAGLGGGSSDAAATLRILNRLWGLNLSAPEMEKLGASLGADVPFLVTGGSAYAEGIGDRLTPVSFRSANTSVLIATPDCFVSTKEAYSGIVPSGEARWEEFKSQEFSLKERPLFNKFEESIFPLYPEIEVLKREFLSAGAFQALMSGSGASVFGLFENEFQAFHFSRKLKGRVRFCTVTKFFSGFPE
ncbi:MAG: 4-(cytidine 5'-diphospho)-2-C-methyl-D-erythritol kinase [Fibrobacter sp.]|jgi:4-diphosphocytidyl-2-C-methyl-D-erythritol kinase|nr:4-(cytidine 5'-diphospho)-2-C-methyl-D-erythritol kinase [Fibrobacter sp.]